MPRTLSKDRLAPHEAAEFREKIRELRDRNSLKNADIANHLGVKSYLVENALKSDRPLLSRAASQLLTAILELCPDAPHQMLMSNWYVSYKESLAGPQILVPTDQATALANFLRRELEHKPGIRKSTLTMIVQTFEHALRRDGPRMANAWRRKSMTLFLFAAAKRAHSTKSREKLKPNVVLDIETQVMWQVLEFIEVSSIGEI